MRRRLRGSSGTARRSWAAADVKETFRTLLNDLIGGYKPPADIPKPWTYPTCAKCGNAEIYTCYHEKNWGDHSCSYASHNKFKSEHLHYSCRRCHWDWCGDVQALDEVDEALDDDLGPKQRHRRCAMRTRGCYLETNCGMQSKR